METLIDYITGKTVPDVGAEANRQAVERFLVEDRGYRKADIRVDAPVEITVGGDIYRSKIDLVVCLGDENEAVIAVKCAAGSLGSREREIVAAARVAGPVQIPISVASDGKTAVVIDTRTGKRLSTGLESIPTRSEMINRLPTLEFMPVPAERLEREKRIFRSYDDMNVNVLR